MEETFRRYDKNKDDLLTVRELGRAEIVELFDVADRNRDGLLDMYEVRAMTRAVNLRVAMRNYGNLQPKAYKVPFSTWDKNKDGRLDTGEWTERAELFPRVDADRDGYVDKREIERYERIVEGDDFVEKFDLNGDGKVTEAEFGGPADAFRRADRNGDGIVTGSDR